MVLRHCTVYHFWTKSFGWFGLQISTTTLVCTYPTRSNQFFGVWGPVLWAVEAGKLEIYLQMHVSNRYFVLLHIFLRGTFILYYTELICTYLLDVGWCLGLNNGGDLLFDDGLPRFLHHFLVLLLYDACVTGDDFFADDFLSGSILLLLLLVNDSRSLLNYFSLLLNYSRSLLNYFPLLLNYSRSLLDYFSLFLIYCRPLLNNYGLYERWLSDLLNNNGLLLLLLLIRPVCNVSWVLYF